MVAEATVDEKEEAATDKEDTSIWCSKQPHHFLLSKVIGLLNLVAFSSGCVKSKLLYQPNNSHFSPKFYLRFLKSMTPLNS